MSDSPLDAGSAGSWEGGGTFTLRNRIYRLGFRLCWALLASWTPPFMHPWRCWLLRCFGAQVAPTAFIYGSVRIWYPPNLRVDDFGTLAPGVTAYTMAPIHIGAYAIVSQGAHLCAGTHDIESPHFQLFSRPITIEPRAWVAAEAFVGPGVTIGEGAVLGARGVAMRNLDAWGVYTGNPATKLRERKLRFAPSPPRQEA